MLSGSPRARESSRVRRGFVWLYVLTALFVALAVLLQAFSIAAYVRGAGPDALELHETLGFITHGVELVVFLAALVGYWGNWRRVGFALLLPVIGTAQLFLIGDRSERGGWLNALHGLLALIVLMLAAVLAQDGIRWLRR